MENYQDWIDLLSLHLSKDEFDALMKEAKAANKFIGLKPRFEITNVDFITIDMLTLVDSQEFTIRP